MDCLCEFEKMSFCEGGLTVVMCKMAPPGAIGGAIGPPEDRQF